jgi:class 3 adenylate cyclase/alpha-beta hydrolase superfamily lysophospholipase
MTNQGVKRKLAGILSADVKGYSRLMEENEIGTIRTLTTYKEIMANLIQRHKGRVVDAPGDNLLAEFASVVEAVQCAMEIQKELKLKNAELPKNSRMEFRIGINLGDVIEENERIYGDGVNVTARVQSLADGGGICISGTAYDHVENKLGVTFEYLGEQTVKNIAKPVRVYRVSMTSETSTPPEIIEQRVQFCTTCDGVRIAFCTSGEGHPLVKTANWLSHMEFYRVSPVTRHWGRELSKHNLFVMYDGRGTGLSDWRVEDLSFQAWVHDLEAVVDAASLDRFVLLGMSGGSAISIAYTVSHPERVSHLILYGAFARGWAKIGLPQHKLEGMQALTKLTEIGWGRSNPAYRQIFTTMFVPEATTEYMHSFNDLQRMSTSPEIAAKFWVEIGNIDVLDLLPKVRVPTMVLHARNDKMVTFEAGRQVASLIPGARFVPLESKNHILLENEPAWLRFLTEIHRFIGVEDNHKTG